MPTSCRDLLSREISDPVHDPVTGVCYRNPCAAEEAGVLDWVPGCVVIEPTYGTYDVGPATWASEVWWNGGGGGGRRRHRRRFGPPGHAGGGRFGPPLHRGLPSGGGVKSAGGRTVDGGPRPGRTMFEPADGGAPGRRMGGGVPIGAGASVDRRLTPYISERAAPLAPTVAYYAQPYATAVTAMRPAPVEYHAQPQPYSHASTMRPTASTLQAQPYRAQSMAPMRAAPMQLHTQPMTMAKGMKGLGQAMMVPTMDPHPPLQQRIQSFIRQWTTGWGPFILGLGAAALAPPVIAGLIAKKRTKSWRTAGLVAVSVAALEAAATGGYTEWHRNHPGGGR